MELRAWRDEPGEFAQVRFGERLPAETDVLMNGRTCAETIETVIHELVDEAIFEAGYISTAWKRPDRHQDLP